MLDLETTLFIDFKGNIKWQSKLRKLKLKASVMHQD